MSFKQTAMSEPVTFIPVAPKQDRRQAVKIAALEVRMDAVEENQRTVADGINTLLDELINSLEGMKTLLKVFCTPKS